MSSAATSRIQPNLQRNDPSESLYHDALLSIRRTADALRRRSAKLLEPFDITPQQYNVLRILRVAGGEGLPTLEIADRMIEHTPGITRMIDRLEAKTLVSRERGADRRQVVCRITPHGIELLTRLEAPVAAAAATGLSDMSDDDLDVAIRVMDRIRAAAER